MTSHPEYRQLTARASIALEADYGTMDLYADAETLRQHATWLYHAYYLTQDERYADKLVELLDAMLALPPTDTQLFTDNFTTSADDACPASFVSGSMRRGRKPYLRQSLLATEHAYPDTGGFPAV